MVFFFSHLMKTKIKYEFFWASTDAKSGVSKLQKVKKIQYTV